MANPIRRTCSTMDVHYRLLASDPAYAARLAAIENRMLSFIATSGATARTGVTVIPVVVHVVHNPARPEENISEAQIKSQIDVLNRDYRMTNPDVASTPAPYSSLAADARIE